MWSDLPAALPSSLLRTPLVTRASFGWWNLWYAVRVTESGRKNQCKATTVQSLRHLQLEEHSGIEDISNKDTFSFPKYSFLHAIQPLK